MLEKNLFNSPPSLGKCNLESEEAGERIIRTSPRLDWWSSKLDSWSPRFTDRGLTPGWMEEAPDWTDEGLPQVEQMTV